MSKGIIPEAEEDLLRAFLVDRVLEVALSCGITVSSHEKYFSGDEQRHRACK